MGSAVTVEGTGSVTDLYPAVYDHAFSVLILLAVTLAVVAMARLWNSESDSLMSFVAFIAILALPIAGPATYLYLARHRRTLSRPPAAGA